VELVECHIVQVVERPVYDDHVDEFSEVSGCNAAEGSAVDAHFSFEAHFLSAKLEHSLAVLPNVVRRRHALTTEPTFATCVPSIVPKHHVDVLLEEETQVEGVWVVDHVLVEHCIRVAQDECGQLFEFFIPFQIFLVELLTSSWEEHGVDFCLAGLHSIFYPDLLAVKCVCQHLAHLLDLAKE